jgi:uncharacterized membrane protein YphA (DoxX/SURF4 family)
MIGSSQSVRVRVLLGHLVEEGGRVHNAGMILRVSPQRAAELVGEDKVELVAAGPGPSRGEVRLLRGMRGVPFLAVALCFLLPFFSASSCGSGASTSATGLNIVTGARLVAQQTQQPLCLSTDPSTCPPPAHLGATGADPVAQRVAVAARPWATTALVLVLVGAALVVVVNRFWRAASLISAGAVLVTLLGMGQSFHARGEDISWETGLQLAILILVVTITWVGVLTIRAANASIAHAIPVGPAIHGLDPRRSGGEPPSGETMHGV